MLVLCFLRYQSATGWPSSCIGLQQGHACGVGVCGRAEQSTSCQEGEDTEVSRPLQGYVPRPEDLPLGPHLFKVQPHSDNAMVGGGDHVCDT